MTAEGSNTSNKRVFPWTRGYINTFGWNSYLHEIVWDILIVYRVRNWRCSLFGHKLGETRWQYEEGFRYEGWRYCERPACEFCQEDEG